MMIANIQRTTRQIISVFNRPEQSDCILLAVVLTQVSWQYYGQLYPATFETYITLPTVVALSILIVALVILKRIFRRLDNFAINMMVWTVLSLQFAYFRQDLDDLLVTSNWTNWEARIGGDYLDETRCIAKTLEGRLRSGVRRNEPMESSFILSILSDNGGRLNLSVQGSDLPWNSPGSLNVGDRVVAELRVCSGKKKRVVNKIIHDIQPYIVLRRIKLNKLSALSQSYQNYRERALLLVVDSQPQNDGLDIVLATTLGYKDRLATHVKDVFNKAGLSHLLVVSGLHVGIFFRCSAALFQNLLVWSRWVVLRGWVTPTARWLGIVCSSMFVLLVGADAPAVRALISAMFYLLAQLGSRRVRRLRLLVLVFILIIEIWPGCFLECGVQLSFAALLGLLCAENLLSLSRQNHSTWKNRIMSSLLYSSCAWCFTAPVTYYWFGQFSPWAPLVNLVFAPPLLLVSLGFGSLGVLAKVLGLPYARTLLWICTVLVDGMLYLLEQVF